ncbi:MAG TPA: tRNA pseudouridine(38-40) synthase TruA [Ramlibacter sp.]|uniref:tRNA pseudouridine(38-40) synthase TruA n=1 Tax=Ramlibacter sp. TaxID=1917967 RepID=UPI002ED4FB73
MRLALGISYNGQAYDGWQSQPSGRTVQDHLEAALQQFATVPVTTVCAGRTDAGVHGVQQVLHLDTEVRREDFSWVRGTNSFLPPDIAVQWARPVPDAFHARNSAKSRRYAYVLLESPVRPSVEAGRVGWVFRPLDADAMQQAAAHLVGTHDFTSFRASSCQSPTPVKTLEPVAISRRGPYWRFEFQGNAFLHHMIRNIMGCLVYVGQGVHPPAWMGEVLEAKSRDAAAPTFSPDGLYFLGPVYEDHWGLPSQAAAYHWLP